jgi:quercetin dioxygenase-like cupin family protein
MNRRHFITAPLALSALAAVTRLAKGDSDSQERVAGGFRVGNSQDRNGEELLIMGGRFDLKVSGRDTGGALCIYDTVRYSKGGPALHKHHAQDEWFYIIRGEFLVQVGEQTLTLRPGDSAFAPRKIPHAFGLTSEGVGQMLVLFQPAGSMEDFFLKMSQMGKGLIKDMETRLKPLFEEHGMEIVGPALKI